MVSLDDAVVARLEKGGKRYEVGSRQCRIG